MTYSTQGIVLKKIPAAEADAVAVLYTADFGKMRAYAQGVKKEHAKLKGHIEPISLTAVQFVLGVAGERLTYAQMMQSWPLIRSDVNRTASALYMTELIDMHCLVGQPDRKIWELLLGSLIELEQCDGATVPACAEMFERGFLACMGYAGAKDMRVLGARLARPLSVVYTRPTA